MKADMTAKFSKKHVRIPILAGILAIVAAVMAVPLRSVLSSSLDRRSRAVVTDVRVPRIDTRSGVASRTANLSPASVFQPLPFAAEGIATFNSDCITPQTDFFLGDVVCAKASGVQPSVFPWRVLWVDTEGFVRQANNASINDATTYMFQIPNTAASTVNEQTVDNRGTWNVRLTRSTGAVRQIATFVVHEHDNPVADAFVQKFVHSESPSVASGDNLAFTIIVGNIGPDGATGVHLIDSVPSSGSLVQFNQVSGPACVPGDSNVPNDCVIAAMANGDRAEFTVIYNIGNSPGDYETSAAISSTTSDPNSDNNTYSAPYQVTASNGGASCQLICPDGITTNANTTEGGQRGAHVDYDPAITSGSCGAISSVPASGTFFPVGTTTVNVTSETGDGSCSFTVTVEEHGNAATISCPASQTVNADSNCQANVTVGTATATGDNVTIFATRSDGKPMYDCDGNGNCTRRAQDDPFQTGATTITWTASSHDAPGPYQSQADEQDHRTGTVSCQQTITVNDVTPPVIGATDQTVSADANCQAVVPDYSSTVTDNCACDSSDDAEACTGHPHVAVTQDPAPGTSVGLGPHTVHITANDGSSNNGGAGNTSTKDVTFTVVDTTPPTFTFVPPAITAYTGPGATTCDAVVDPGTATAADNCGPITITRSPSGNTFPVGTTTIVWTAADGANNTVTATQTITVIDNTAPTITLNGVTPSMWPPNHKYQTFTTSTFVASVFDNCGGVSVNDVRIAQVTSDETENGNGDGNTLNDIVISADCKSIQLRSERDGGGNGRVYTITLRLTDTHGNTTTANAKVVVPHNPGETVVDSGVHYTVNGNCP
jgi:uncharacterized repeat protein (TIGR01451 family)